MAYRIISLDSIKGAENKGKVFWGNIAEKFNELSSSDVVREAKGLEVLWSRMSPDMVTWAGCMKAVRRNPASGTAPIDDYEAAHKRFKAMATKKDDLERQKKPTKRRKPKDLTFKFVDAWEEVKQLSKFNPSEVNLAEVPGRDFAKAEKIGLKVTPSKKKRVKSENSQTQIHDLFSSLKDAVEVLKAPVSSQAPEKPLGYLDEIDRLMKVLGNWENIFKASPDGYPKETQERIRKGLMDEIAAVQSSKIMSRPVAVEKIDEPVVEDVQQTVPEMTEEEKQQQEDEFDTAFLSQGFSAPREEVPEKDSFASDDDEVKYWKGKISEIEDLLIDTQKREEHFKRRKLERQTLYYNK